MARDEKLKIQPTKHASGKIEYLLVDTATGEELLRGEWVEIKTMRDQQAGVTSTPAAMSHPQTGSSLADGEYAAMSQTGPHRSQKGSASTALLAVVACLVLVFGIATPVARDSLSVRVVSSCPAPSQPAPTAQPAVVYDWI